MKKYIDAEKLKKIINNLDTETCISEEATGFYDAIDKVCDVIDSLQQEQPEVDLEEEIEEHAIYMPHGEFASDNEIIEDMEWSRKEFRHFYELGFDAGKKK